MLNVLTKKSEDKKKKKGFTLIELIIVIAIIAILAAIAVPKFMNVTKDAKVKADIANAKTIESAITTALATDKLTFKSGSTTEVNLSDLLQNIPKGKYKEGKFMATVTSASATDDRKVIKVQIVDDTGKVVAVVLGEGQDSEYAN